MIESTPKEAQRQEKYQPDDSFIGNAKATKLMAR
jgi:hypothetical protein